MAVSFPEAAKRHFKDSEVLYKNECFGGADYLIGLSMECALKGILEKLQIGKTQGKYLCINGKKSGGHLPGYFSEYSSHTPSGYVLRLNEKEAFDGWNVDERYDSNSDFSQTKAEGRINATRQVLSLLEKAEMEQGS